MEIKGTIVEDTYAEAFDGLFARMIVTAKNSKLLKKAVYDATALPCTVFGEAEGGVEAFLSPQETPDGRIGAIIQLWVAYTKNAKDKLTRELGKRIRQGILVVPTTRVFDAPMGEKKDEVSMMEIVGHCGDGHEWTEERFGRTLINVPLMMGEFLIDGKITAQKGVAGGNIWLFCESEEDALNAAEKCVLATDKVPGAIAPFDICSAGSKVETNFPEIGPTTNHPFCPTLKGKIADFKVPEGIVSIPEIVIDGTSLDAVRDAMKACVDAAAGMDGVRMISAGNFGGKLGRHHIYLKDLI